MRFPLRFLKKPTHHDDLATAIFHRINEYRQREDTATISWSDDLSSISRRVCEIHYHDHAKSGQERDIYNDCRFVSVFPCDLRIPSMDRFALLSLAADAHDHDVILNSECNSGAVAVFGKDQNGYLAFICSNGLHKEGSAQITTR